VTCSYTTAHEVNLLPLKIDKVELGGVPADLPLAQLGLSQRGSAAPCGSASPATARKTSGTWISTVWSFSSPVRILRR
jgi:type VI secretion system protein ImpG